MCHGMKLYERVVGNRLRESVDISSRQYGFQPGKSIFYNRTHLYSSDDARKVHGEAERISSDVCRCGEGIQQSTQIVDLVDIEKRRSRGSQSM